MFDFLEEGHREALSWEFTGLFSIGSLSAVPVESRLGTFIVQLQSPFVYTPTRLIAVTSCQDY